MPNTSHSFPTIAHIVDVFRCCDCGVLKGAADAWRCWRSKEFLEKYLFSAPKMPFLANDRCGIVPFSAQRPHRGSKRENMALGCSGGIESIEVNCRAKDLRHVTGAIGLIDKPAMSATAIVFLFCKSIHLFIFFV